jgi:feruloyl esterase
MAASLWTLANAVVKVFAHSNDPVFRTRDVVKFSDGGPGSITAFRGVVPRSQVEAVQGAVRTGYGHNPVNFDNFLRQNRKLLIWHNFSDEKLTPYMSVNLYKKLAARHGGYAKLQDTARLFALPGTAHCSGGGLPVGPGSFDALSAMENWVEKGRAPDGLLATLYKPTPISADYSKPLGRTMPLCKFPEMARYNGSGDVLDATNWVCRRGDKSMLTVGESGRRAGVID